MELSLFILVSCTSRSILCTLQCVILGNNFSISNIQKESQIPGTSQNELQCGSAVHLVISNSLLGYNLYICIDLLGPVTSG